MKTKRSARSSAPFPGEIFTLNVKLSERENKPSFNKLLELLEHAHFLKMIGRRLKSSEKKCDANTI